MTLTQVIKKKNLKLFLLIDILLFSACLLLLFRADHLSMMTRKQRLLIEHMETCHPDRQGGLYSLEFENRALNKLILNFDASAAKNDSRLKVSFSESGEAKQEQTFIIGPRNTLINAEFLTEKRGGNCVLQLKAEPGADVQVSSIRIEEVSYSSAAVNRLLYILEALAYTAVLHCLFLLLRRSRITKRTAAEYGLAAAAAVLLFFVFYEGWKWNITSAPCTLRYEDDMHFLSVGKNAIRGGNFWIDPRLCAPYGTERYDFPMLMALYYGFFRFAGLFTKNIIFVNNLYFLGTFVAGVLLTVYTGKKIRLPYPLALAGGIMLMFSQYHFAHSMGHMTAAAYFVILPLFLFCWKVMFEEPADGKAVLKELPYLVVWSFMIGSADVFYAYFGCAFLTLTIIIALIRKRYRSAAMGCIMIGLIVAAGILNLYPVLYHRLIYGKGSGASKRSPYEAFYYGLLLIHLLMPQGNPEHPLYFLTRKFYRYSLALRSPEFAYLGVLGILGLAASFVIMAAGRGFSFAGRKDPGPQGEAEQQVLPDLTEKICFLGVLNVFAFLFGSSAGIGPIIAMLGFSMVRVYNRIAIFIMLFSILTLLLLLYRIMQNRRWSRTAVCAAAVLIAGIQMADVQPWNMRRSRSEIDEGFQAFRRMTAYMEANAGEHNLILQLPAVTYPENTMETGYNNNLRHVLVYCLSDHLNLSCGPLRGTKADCYQQLNFRSDDMKTVLENAVLGGYTGLYFDTTMYLDGQEKLAEICSLLKKSPDYAEESQGLYYFDLRGQEKKNLPAESDNLIYQIEASEKAGWHNLEDWHDGDARWAGYEDTSSLWMMIPQNRPYHLSFQISCVLPQDLEVILDGTVLTKIHLEPGKNEFTTRAVVSSGTDMKQLLLKHTSLFRPCDINPDSTDERILTAAYTQIRLICE